MCVAAFVLIGSWPSLAQMAPGYPIPASFQTTFNRTIKPIYSASVIPTHNRMVDDSAIDPVFGGKDTELPMFMEVGKPIKVIRILDGDTIKVQGKTHRFNIRLCGIDAPEDKSNIKVREDAARSQLSIETLVAMGKRATTFMKSILAPGEMITIEMDNQLADRYGRSLGYVYRKDGTMVNLDMAKAGFAIPMTISPNVKYAEKFEAAYREAVAQKKGLFERAPTLNWGR